jgi:glycosyltransferase involved in cell wall biosynthesis
MDQTPPLDELVSVIIPAHNAEKWVGATLDSVVAQTYAHVEIIVVDAGSQDGTVPIVREKLANRFAGLWQVLQLSGNGGPGAARNAGLERATGSWIQFLDADDFLAPVKLERQMSYCLTAPADIVAVYSPWRRCYFEDSTIVWDGPIAKPNMDGRAPIMCLVGGDRYLHPAGLARRATLEQIGGFDQSLRFWECEEINVRIAREGRLKCVPADEPLYLWRMHRGQVYIGGANARYPLTDVALSWIELAVKAAEFRPLSELNLPKSDEKEILDSCTIWARRLYAKDRGAFDKFLTVARKLAPKLAPTQPGYASLAARCFGYERAESIAWWAGTPRILARKALEQMKLRERDSIFD